MIESIEVKNIDIQFNDFKVVENLSFKITPGFWRVDSSLGGGKSVVLRLLAGILAPKNGELLFNGKDRASDSFEQWSDVRLSLGYSFDFGGLLSNRSLYDNLLLPLLYHNVIPTQEAEERVNSLLEKFELLHVKGKYPCDATGSQRKALCVVRSLIMSPEVLLLDDPTTALKHSVVEALFEEVYRQMKHERLKFVIYTSDDERMRNRFPAQKIDCRSVISEEKVA